MTSRERVIAALTFQPVDRAPRQLWVLPGVSEGRRDEYEALVARYHWDFTSPDARYGVSPYAQGEPYRVGEYVDEYGSEWSVMEYGVIGEVRVPRLAHWAQLNGYRLPYELLDGADFSAVNARCQSTDQFVLAGTFTRPFERAQFLRGTENLFIDLASDEPALHKLLGMLHEFSLREMRMWAATAVDGISFMDDWGAQQALLISPAMWRRVFKPMYKEYCDILRRAGKFVFFHSDGFIEDIYPDLIEIGVHAVNSQLFCMDIERLGRDYGGKITFWGEMDRQHLLPFGTPDAIRAAVKRARAALQQPNGSGVIAQCEWGKRDPLDNVAALYDAWAE